MVNPELALLTPTLTPVKSILPIPVVLIPVKSVLKSAFNTLMSWSFVNASVGVNNRFLTPVFKICVSNTPKLVVVKSSVFVS